MKPNRDSPVVERGALRLPACLRPVSGILGSNPRDNPLPAPEPTFRNPIQLLPPERNKKKTMAEAPAIPYNPHK